MTRPAGPPPLRLLLLDDDPELLAGLQTHLKRDHEVVALTDPVEGLARLGREPFDLVVTDQQMPGMTGLEMMRQARAQGLQTPFVFLTVVDEVETAVEILRSGAADYLRKPVTRETLLHRLGSLTERLRLDREVKQLRRRVDSLESRSELVGSSPAILQLLEQLAMVSPTPAPVLLVGETGTGKEVLARLIHRNSPRASQLFLAVNCGGLPTEILDSELFGHARGAFTGAEQARRGMVEEATQGTLFLDEIGDISPALQVKLLRVLQEQEVRRMGENRPIKVGTRFVAATHRDLPTMVAQGKFREDLLYRLNMVTLRVPPLRERREDIPLLLQHFLALAAAEYGKPVRGILSEALHRALVYTWPGNVRELENLVKRAVIFCAGDRLGEQELFGNVMVHGPGEQATGLTLREAERRHVLETLKQCGYHRGRTARALGISVRALQYKLRHYGQEAAPQDAEAASGTGAGPT